MEADALQGLTEGWDEGGGGRPELTLVLDPDSLHYYIFLWIPLEIIFGSALFCSPHFNQSLHNNVFAHSTVTN